MSNIYFPQPEPDSLGAIVGSDDVRDAVAATIGTWSPFYIAVLSTRLAAAGKIGPTGPLNGQNQPIIPTPLSAFGTWENEPTFRNVGTGMPAAYLVSSPGTAQRPERAGDGSWRAVYAAMVQVQVFGLDWQTTADLTSWYEKAVRWSIMQHRSLGGFAENTAWMGTVYEKGRHFAKRVEGVARIRFDVRVLDILEDNRGPKTLPPPPFVAPTLDPTVEYTGPGAMPTGTSADTPPVKNTRPDLPLTPA